MLIKTTMLYADDPGETPESIPLTIDLENWIVKYYRASGPLATRIIFADETSIVVGMPYKEFDDLYESHKQQKKIDL